MQKVRISDAQREIGSTVHSQEADQLDGIGRRGLRAGRLPLDATQVRRDERGLARRDQVEQGRPWQQRRIQPKRMIRDQVIDARRTEVIATHRAAAHAPRGEHAVLQRAGPI